MKKELKLTAVDNLCILLKTHCKAEAHGELGNSDSSLLASAKFLVLINNQLVDAGFTINNILNPCSPKFTLSPQAWPLIF